MEELDNEKANCEQCNQARNRDAQEIERLLKQLARMTTDISEEKELIAELKRQIAELNKQKDRRVLTTISIRLNAKNNSVSSVTFNYSTVIF